MPAAIADTPTTLPPHSVEAEQALLGAVFLDRDVLNEAQLIIRDAEWFYRTAHRLIYDSMRRLHDRGMEIDWITVKEDLARHGELDAAGGQEYLQEITELMAQSVGAHQWAEIVRDKAILREIIRSATEVRNDAYNPTADPAELIERFEGEVFRLGNARFMKGTKSIPDLMKEVRKQLDFFKKLRNEHGAVPGLTSGYLARAQHRREDFVLCG
jgi:replicative DNA helicase